MKYTIDQFRKDFPNDDACLESVLLNRYADLSVCPKCGQKTKYYKVRGRKCYECMHCGKQIYPLANTIFHKSSTSLWNWFYAIYLFSNSKNGVSAKELERQLGVTYKCAWRMAHQIRKLMEQDDSMLKGTIEVDETYVGGKLINRSKKRQSQDEKQVLFGAISREQGKAKVFHVSGNGARILIDNIRNNVKLDSMIYSDESASYKSLDKIGYFHWSVNHSKSQYVKRDTHTNSIEGFWSQLKRSINGTYHSVSPKYLQSYVDEFSFRYNHRDSLLFPVLLKRVEKQVL